MSEILNSFRLGKMEKDLDDRLLLNGSFRDALNVEIATSDGSDVGALQKVKGNVLLAGLPSLPTDAKCIGSVRDTKNNNIYWFVTSTGFDFIAEYNGTAIDMVLVDRGVILDFHPDFLITGVNILDEVIYFTDNRNEPRQVDIAYWKNLTHNDHNQTSTGLSADKITVIRKSPLNSPYYTALPSAVVSGPGTEDGTRIVMKIDGNLQIVLSTYTLNEESAITGITFAELLNSSQLASPSYVVGTNITLTNTVGQTADLVISHVNTDPTPHEFKATITYIDPAISVTESSNSLKKRTAGQQFSPSAGLAADMSTAATGNTSPQHFLITPASSQDWMNLPVAGPYVIETAITLQGAPADANHNAEITIQYEISTNSSSNWATYRSTMSFEHLVTNQGSAIGSNAFNTTNTFVKNFAVDNYVLGTKIRFRVVKTTPSATDITGFVTKAEGNIPLKSSSAVDNAYDVNLKESNGNAFPANGAATVNSVDYTYRRINVLGVGMLVSGQGIPDNTKITAISSNFNKITLNNRVTIPIDTALTFNGCYVRVASDVTRYSSLSDEALGNFEFKFPRFSYRYKYNNNQYSCYAPFSLPAFVPGNFKYQTKDGYNKGMENKIKSLTLKGWNDSIPDLVDEVDVLYKDSSNQNVYVVETLKKINNNPIVNTLEISNDQIYKVLPSMQLLRTFDSVPKKALAQEIIGNRLVYANYTQNINYTNQVSFIPFIDQRSDSLQISQKLSLKSNRTYQFGVVFQDTYGRQTPVFIGTGGNGIIKIPKKSCILKNQFRNTVETTVSNEITHFKYFIKETSNEYYNIAVANFYSDDENFIYLSVPSSDISKVKEGDYLIAKKQNGANVAYSGNQDTNRMKVISIEKSPPKSINKEYSIDAGETIQFGSGFGSDTAVTAKTSGCTPTVGHNKIQIFSLNASGSGSIPTSSLDRLVVGALIRFSTSYKGATTRAYEISKVRKNGESGANRRAELTFTKTFKGDVNDLYQDNGQITDASALVVTEKEFSTNSNYDSKFFIKVNDSVDLKSSMVSQTNVDDLLVLASAQLEASDGSYIISNATSGQTSLTITTHADYNDAGSDYINDSFISNLSVGNFIRLSDISLNNKLEYSNVYNISTVVASTVNNKRRFVLTLSTALLVTVTSGRIDILGIVGGKITDFSNPAVFEVEPEEGLLDLYYEDSRTYATSELSNTTTNIVCSVNGNVSSTALVVDAQAKTITAGMLVTGTGIDEGVTIITVTSQTNLVLSSSQTIADGTSLTLKKSQLLDYSNCFSFGNGVESDRIRDDFNAITIGKGVRVSTVFEDVYAEEILPNRFIYSQLYNSSSGVNRLNQFIIADSITKDVNPSHGSIQLIRSRDTDLIALCEDKCFRVQANKDALFTANGDPQVTASFNVLGQVIPYVGEYGISKNPESFAQYGFRAYFTDKERGVVLRLSRDGLSEVSAAGMSDYFSDKLGSSTGSIFGSYDDKKNSYNLSFSDDTISFNERVNGWTSRKSFIPEGGLSLNNDYFTFKSGKIYKHHSNSSSSVFYLEEAIVASHRVGSDYEFIIATANANISVNDYVVGKGIPDNVRISSKLGNNTTFYLNTIIATGAILAGEKLHFSPTPIYDKVKSTVKFIINEAINEVKRFKNISYEGDLAWEIDTISTNEHTGTLDTAGFIKKEGKYYSSLKGSNASASTLNAEEFNVQGLGLVNSVSGSVLTFTDGVSNSLQVNDKIYFLQNNSVASYTSAGSCTAKTANTITINGTAPASGKFVLYDKGGVANQAGLLGFFATVDMKHLGVSSAEIFSVGSMVV